MSAQTEAVDIFAQQGIQLLPTPGDKDLVWTHEPYLKAEPVVKDLLVRIRVGNCMGAIVHQVEVPNVHHDDASQVAEKVLVDYRKSKPKLVYGGLTYADEYSMRRDIERDRRALELQVKAHPEHWI